MKPYHLVITRFQKDLVKLRIERAQPLKLKDKDERAWLIADAETDSKALTKLTKVLSNHHIGGRWEGTGGIYAVTLSDAETLIKSVIGDDVVTTRTKKWIEKSRNELAVSKDKERKFYQARAKDWKVLFQVFFWAFILVYGVIRLAVWLILFPIAMSKLRKHTK